MRRAPLRPWMWSLLLLLLTTPGWAQAPDAPIIDSIIVETSNVFDAEQARDLVGQFRPQDGHRGGEPDDRTQPRTPARPQTANHPRNATQPEQHDQRHGDQLEYQLRRSAQGLDRLAHCRSFSISTWKAMRNASRVDCPLPRL